MSGVDMSKANEKAASLTLKLKASSGYCSTETHKISANQWADILLICADAEARHKMAAADDLLEALEWAVERLDYLAQGNHESVAAARAAIARARGEQA